MRRSRSCRAFDSFAPVLSPEWASRPCRSRSPRLHSVRPLLLLNRRLTQTPYKLSLAWISDAPEKQTDPAGHVLNSVNEWAIDFHFDRRRRRRSQRAACQHCHGGCGSRFSSFFVHRDERLVKDLRDVEVIVRCSWRDLVEIGAALRLIERSLHPERFKLFGQSNGWWFEFEFWQMEIDISLFDFCAAGEHVTA